MSTNRLAWHVRTAAALLAGALASACADPDPFPCSVDSECLVDGSAGQCERNAYCSYPDVACEPGRRWGPYAGDGLAEACTSQDAIGASYVGCAGPTTPPTECAAFAGPDRSDVDVLDGDTLERSTGYLYFDLGGIPDSAVVLAAQLELTAVDSGDGDSDAAGRIVPVEPFTIEDLEAGRLPAPLPTEPSASPGSVALGQTLQWAVDPSAVLPGQRLYLALEPGSADNAQYWSTSGAVPPRLLVQLSR